MTFLSLLAARAASVCGPKLAFEIAFDAVEAGLGRKVVANGSFLHPRNSWRKHA
ncbi:hypothetical protein MTX26_28305 [Bradyrhizobium sp. ISRA443]|uniref:hypothetical protein n=1 Tax=unclassified Bradyrhizobium TaxID=2631580 RepID=UPI0024797BF1|nr:MULTISPECIES: hypothetical protein [unclassified Bradyrhizobium]WGR98141.1 hypothetical protein MTX23_28295 [Bradyrhizobium sp. ISRA436]WGS05029.1 hypothetical protein MTX18_28310 [Bradyrhizobium sp. ISRA437]WGS11915.1 hypothetical protein MTX26_28305 [Bradyrhizobium sp. ISRA443]